MSGRRPVGLLHIITVAAAYVGAVVGGGFATGREVLHFFASPVNVDGSALLLAAGGFMLGGAGLMILIGRLNIRSSAEIIAVACSGSSSRLWAGRLLTVFYFLILGVVFSAAAALADGWGLRPHFGALGMAAAVAICLIIGPRGIGAVNLMLLAVLATVLLSTAFGLTSPATIPIGGPSGGAGAVAPVLYVSYNLVFALAVFPDLGAANAKTGAAGAALGGGLLGILCWAEWRIMAEVYRNVAWADVPLRVAVSLVRPSIADVYPILVLFSLLTTGIAVGCGLLDPRSIGRARWRSVSLAVLLALPVSMVNLSQLVQTLYPLLGCLSLLFWLQLFRRSWRLRQFYR